MLARFFRRRLEGATQRGRDSGVGGGNVHPDNPSISCVNVHGRKFFLLRFHCPPNDRTRAEVSFKAELGHENRQ